MDALPRDTGRNGRRWIVQRSKFGGAHVHGFDAAPTFVIGSPVTFGTLDSHRFVLFSL